QQGHGQTIAGAQNEAAQPEDGAAVGPEAEAPRKRVIKPGQSKHNAEHNDCDPGGNEQFSPHTVETPGVQRIVAGAPAGDNAQKNGEQQEGDSAQKQLTQSAAQQVTRLFPVGL